ncbi:MAG: pyridoxal-phosphate dependent enzyme [Rhodothermales bacterium]|nr:pyridoxal-phosphate dependent enzyme [Rhodothermales bacterium]
MWHDSILGTIGDTPLVKLNRIATGLPCTLLAKVEFFNPGGSVKDRIGVYMIRAAEKNGDLKPGGTIIECTSGNTGAGLAIAGIALGYRCIFTTTDKQSQEKVDVLRALGAEVIVCPTNVHADDPRSYYSVARRLASEIPNSFHVNQYDNPANTQAHYETTGPELWEQTGGKISHYFAGGGTGGTITGTTRYLKEQNPDIKTIGVDPYGSVYYTYFHTGVFDKDEIYPYLTEGVGEDILTGNMDFSVVDDFVRVDDKTSMQYARALSRKEGLFIGQSCGMVVAGAVQWLEANRKSVKPTDIAVVLLPDSGFRYLSKLYNDNWMRGHGFLESTSSMTVGDIIDARGSKEMMSVGPEVEVGVAIKQMTEHAVSQIPVLSGDDVVGSLSERGVLSQLLLKPDLQQAPVSEVMKAPLKVVGRELAVDQLATYLETDSGAVLVKNNEKFEIITKSDLLDAIVHSGTSGP